MKTQYKITMLLAISVLLLIGIVSVNAQRIEVSRSQTLSITNWGNGDQYMCGSIFGQAQNTVACCDGGCSGVGTDCTVACPIGYIPQTCQYDYYEYQLNYFTSRNSYCSYDDYANSYPIFTRSCDCVQETPTCTDTCSSLGYNCGTHSVCGSNVNCGTCAGSQTCNSNGQCVAGCTPQCSGKSCGSDGCSGSCGTCQNGQTCNLATGTCGSSCTPTTCSALGKNCGIAADGCGNTLTCGTCGSGQTCSSSICVNQSICTPTCASGYTCQNSQCVANTVCSIDTDCPTGNTCVNSVCTPSQNYWYVYVIAAVILGLLVFGLFYLYKKSKGRK